MTELVYGADGLIPVVVQHAGTNEVLMLAYANSEAVSRTRATGRVHFYSRSRARLWCKGETSGHYLLVEEIIPDCDRDALLIRANPTGPTCHTGRSSCFGRRGGTVALDILCEVWEVLCERKRGGDSYSARLLQSGLDAVLKKVGEESMEVALAASHESDDRVVSEVADLWFFTLAVLCLRGIAPRRVAAELADRRRGQGGIPEDKKN